MNDSLRRIVVCRRPEKDGDNITPHGAKQIFAAAKVLREKFGRPDHFLISGASGTYQAAVVAAAAMRIYPIQITENTGLHFEDIFYCYLRKADAETGLLEEFTTLNAQHDGAATVYDAITNKGRLGKFARAGRDHLRLQLKEQARRMVMRQHVFHMAVSHMCWAELAVFNPDSFPFGIGLADAIVYMVSPEADVVSSELVVAPAIDE